MARKTWPGKEKVLESLVKFSENTRPFWSTKKEVEDQMKVRKNLLFAGLVDMF
jgi:hypothetical protein